MDFMRQRGVVEAAFSIFDGGAEVGGGVLGGVGVMNMLFDEEGSE